MEVKGNTSFTSVMAVTQTRQQSIPQQYILPPSQRPNTTPVDQTSTSLPVIDLSMMDHPTHRPQLVHQVHAACNQLGFFQAIHVSYFHFSWYKNGNNAGWTCLLHSLKKCSQKETVEKAFRRVINHGIPTSVKKDAIDSAEQFFDLPSHDKMCFASADVHEPVRYGTSMNHEMGKVFYWRDFIKHYANPISEWIHLWPSNPPTYKEKMGSYAKAMQVLQKKLMEVVLESLGLNAKYLHDDIKEGSQVIAVNCYPSCPEPDLALGMPPHTDYGTLTILNQSHQGLEIMDHDKKWHPVPFIEGALIVQLGDQFEVISNGRYKSIPHRAILNVQRKRFSIASLHSMQLETKVGPEPQLVDKQHPAAYREGSFGEFLDYISMKTLTEGKYIDMLKNP